MALGKEGRRYPRGAAERSGPASATFAPPFHGRGTGPDDWRSVRRRHDLRYRQAIERASHRAGASGGAESPEAAGQAAPQNALSGGTPGLADGEVTRPAAASPVSSFRYRV